MDNKKYICDYINQLRNDVKLYDDAHKVINKITDFSYFHAPIDWDWNDIIGLIDYLYDYYKSLNNNNIIRDNIGKNFNELFNIITLNKLKDLKEKYNTCINILGTSQIYLDDYKVIDIRNVIDNIDRMINCPYANCSILKIRKYGIKYTDDEIAIMKKYILKIRDELINISNNLTIPDKEDWRD